MFSKPELEALDLTKLAVLCGEVARKPPAVLGMDIKAAALRHEWGMLMASETPPPSDDKILQEIQNKKAALRIRIVEFLSAV